LSRVPRVFPRSRVFVVAGGSSVASQPVGLLPPGEVLAVKHAVLLVPQARVLFWGGRTWHLEAPAALAAHRGPWKIKRTIDPAMPRDVIQVARTPLEEQDRLSLDPRCLAGACSGGSALNLAFLAGARQIVLVGFDLQGEHWLEDHPVRREREEAHERHRRAIDGMADGLAAAGVDVVNVSPTSALTCYRRSNFHDFLPGA
jgi:hypothetical protein